MSLCGGSWRGGCGRRLLRLCRRMVRAVSGSDGDLRHRLVRDGGAELGGRQGAGSLRCRYGEHFREPSSWDGHCWDSGMIVRVLSNSIIKRLRCALYQPASGKNEASFYFSLFPWPRQWKERTVKNTTTAAAQRFCHLGRLSQLLHLAAKPEVNAAPSLCSIKTQSKPSIMYQRASDRPRSQARLSGLFRRIIGPPKDVLALI